MSTATWSVDGHTHHKTYPNGCVATIRTGHTQSRWFRVRVFDPFGIVIADQKVQTLIDAKHLAFKTAKAYRAPRTAAERLGWVRNPADDYQRVIRDKNPRIVARVSEPNDNGVRVWSAECGESAAELGASAFLTSCFQRADRAALRFLRSITGA